MTNRLSPNKPNGKCKVCGRPVPPPRTRCWQHRRRHALKSGRCHARVPFSSGAAGTPIQQPDVEVEYVIYCEHDQTVRAIEARYDNIVCPDLPRLGRVTGPALATSAEIVARWRQSLPDPLKVEEQIERNLLSGKGWVI